jgi:hypothetical protein
MPDKIVRLPTPNVSPAEATASEPSVLLCTTPGDAMSVILVPEMAAVPRSPPAFVNVSTVPAAWPFSSLAFTVAVIP